MSVSSQLQYYKNWTFLLKYYKIYSTFDENRGLGYFNLNIRNCIELKNLSYVHLDKIKSNLDGGIGRLVMFYNSYGMQPS